MYVHHGAHLSLLAVLMTNMAIAVVVGVVQTSMDSVLQTDRVVGANATLKAVTWRNGGRRGMCEDQHRASPHYKSHPGAERRWLMSTKVELVTLLPVP